MKTLLPFIAVLSYSQTLTPSLSEPFSYPGSTFSLSISFQDTAPTSSIAAFQWTVAVPAGFTIGTPIPGAASVAAGKTITCNPTTFVCISFGENTNVYAQSGGVVATIPITVTSAAQLGAQQISLTGLVASTLAGTSVPITAPAIDNISISPSTGTTTWFSVSAGQATCRASKVSQTPIRVSWICLNSYGANAGSYTADAVNGGIGANFFTIGINSIGAPLATLPDENLSCSIHINATANPLTMLNGTMVPGNSAAYSCTGYSTSGSGILSWP
jgi:hypothetical protein